jgi:hypothetical protein
MTTSSLDQAWPELPYEALRPTADTLQLWMQVVGKVRLVRTHWLNHSWHATLYVSARGLTTPLIPGDGFSFQFEFDLMRHLLLVRSTSGGERSIPLRAGEIAGFYAEVMEALSSLGAPTRIVAAPNELPDATPFWQDHRPRPYDPDMATAYWRALVQADRLFHRFRSRFLGKCSPVHLFWGAGDLAVTRFSGRRAPMHPGGVPHLPDDVTREAYSHEVSSAGFWPGDNAEDGPCFYAYAYPAPEGFSSAKVAPAAARFDQRLGEFLLPYEAVRTAADPDEALLAFLQSTYDAAANLGGWPREGLDCEEGPLGHPRPSL